MIYAVIILNELEAADFLQNVTRYKLEIPESKKWDVTGVPGYLVSYAMISSDMHS